MRLPARTGCGRALPANTGGSLRRRTRLGALALAAGVAAALLPTAPAAAIPTPTPSRTATIAVDGAGECWTGSAEGRLTWSPGAPVWTVRVTATVVNAEIYDPNFPCGIVPGTHAVFTAYSGRTEVDSQAINAYEAVAAISFDLAGGPLDAIDRVEVTMCWWPDVVASGADPVEDCDEDSQRIS
jgi:hypothetical protein